jgi:hypothetical protein
MEARIETTLKASAGSQAGGAPANPMRQQAAALRLELAGLSAGARASQAWWGGMSAGLSGLVPEGAANSRPLIAVNPDFLNRGLPRTAIQILTVYFSWASLSEAGPAASPHIGDHRLYEFLRGADWKRIAAAIERSQALH